MKKTTIAVALVAAGISAYAQTSFPISIIGDNDFALFSGTSSSVDQLLYQNNYVWQDQLANESGLSFALQPGETTFYLLALGAGGIQDNISGTINGVDITSIPVSMSSDIGPSLSGYEGQNTPAGTVALGTYDAELADVQLALPSATWSDAALNINTTDIVVQGSPNGIGYDIPISTAHLFEFSAASVSVMPVPEPGTIALAGIGIASLLALRRRK